MARFVVMGEAPGRGGADDPVHSRLFECPEVGSIRNQMGWKLVVATVARDKRDFDSVDRPYGQRCRRVAKGRIDGDFPGVLEEFVETGTPNDSDHQSSPFELLDLESLDLESLDLDPLDLDSLDLGALFLELLDLELLDFESVT
jgi:hypothetical protein